MSKMHFTVSRLSRGYNSSSKFEMVLGSWRYNKSMKNSAKEKGKTNRKHAHEDSHCDGKGNRRLDGKPIAMERTLIP